MKNKRCKFCGTADQTMRWFSKTCCHNCYQQRYVESNKLNRVCVACGSIKSKGSWYRGPTCSKCYHNKRYRSGRGRSLSQKYSHLISQSKRRNAICEISKEEYETLITSGCHYCSRNLLELTGHSLDKVNTDTGYVIGNVLPCCGDCNTVRMNILTVQETIEVVGLIRKLRNTTGCPWLLYTRANESV